MTGTVKFFWCSLLFFGLGSCESRIYEGTPETACNGGECEYNFEINPEQQPDTYLDNEGYWHVYTGGLAFYVGIVEKKVDIGYWDAVYLMMFVWAMMRCKKNSLRKIKYISAKKNITISK